MSVTPDSTFVDPKDHLIADLQRQLAKRAAERDEALQRDAALTARLAQRDGAYEERTAYQAATIDVLHAMSASPGDPQPVFELIVDRARDLCDAYGASLWEFDGTLIHMRAWNGISDDPVARQAVTAMYPMVPTRASNVGRTILDRQLTRFDDFDTDLELHPTLRGLTRKSSVQVPMMR